METRTELILLQRTMVVVEGVARSLDPHINIWSTARPVVEKYIADNVGPKAMIRDLLRTAKVLARFGPKLPELAEAALVAQSHRGEPVRPRQKPVRWLVLIAVAALAFAAGHYF